MPERKYCAERLNELSERTAVVMIEMLNESRVFVLNEKAKQSCIIGALLASRSRGEHPVPEQERCMSLLSC